MSNPQKENGFTAIANELLEALIAYRISGEQMKCLLFIIRKTYGYQKKEDAIALSQFSEYTKMNKPAVCRALKSLQNKNMIIIKFDNKVAKTYQFNKQYKTWKPLSKKIILSKKIMTVINIDKKRYQNRVPQKKKENITKETIRHRIPKDYCLHDKHIKYFKSKNAPGDINDIFEDFCLYHKKKGNKFVDWNAAWQTWVRNHIKFNKETEAIEPDDTIFR